MFNFSIPAFFIYLTSIIYYINANYSNRQSDQSWNVLPDICSGNQNLAPSFWHCEIEELHLKPQGENGRFIVLTKFISDDLLVKENGISIISLFY